MTVTWEQFIQLVTAIAASRDYHNFKNSCHDEQPHDREYQPHAVQNVGSWVQDAESCLTLQALTIAGA